MTRQEFLAWEAFTRDTIDVKRCYIDLADDLVAGILLSQIVYWHLPNKDGGEKLRVEKDGVMWLAKGRADWWEECRITAKQFDRAAEILEAKGLIERKVMRFGGSPTVHVRLCWEEFLRDMALLSMSVKGGNMEVTQKAKTEIPRRSKTYSPKVKNDVPVSTNSLTETPSETKTKNTQREAASPPAPAARVCISSSQETEKAEEKEPVVVNLPEKPTKDDLRAEIGRCGGQAVRAKVQECWAEAATTRAPVLGRGPVDWMYLRNWAETWGARL